MEKELEVIIRQALQEARRAGKDTVAQNVQAIEAVRQVRPNLSPLEAMVLVNMVRQT